MHTTVVISNPLKPWLQPVALNCRVDSSSLMLSIPGRIARNLQLNILEKKLVILEDGSQIYVPYAGPVNLSFNHCDFIVCAFVMGNDPVLGAVRLSETDFIIVNGPHSIVLNSIPQHAMYWR